jgi:hypothetical protein
MSFQRAMKFMDRIKPKKDTFLVHIGDGDMVAGAPTNIPAKKSEPKYPTALRRIPLHHPSKPNTVAKNSESNHV